MSVLLGEVRTALSRHSRAVSVDAVEELLELAPAAVRLTSRPLARAVVTGGRDDLSSGFLGPRRVDAGGAHRAGAIEPELSWVWAALEGRPGFSRQWASIVARIRNELDLSILRALSDGATPPPTTGLRPGL